MIKVDNIFKNYPLGKTQVKALQNVSLEIKQQEFVSIIGPSGSGKTTLLNILGLLDTPDSGNFYLDGENISQLNSIKLAQLRAQKIGFVFQSFNLVPALNIYDNVALALTLSKQKMSEQSRRDAVYKVIEEVGLTSYIKHKPDELSGGQRQRVAIARALVKKPQIIIADEPTANLDSTTTYEIVKLMQHLNKEEKTTFLFSTHDERLMKFLDRTIHLEDGMVRENSCVYT